MAIKPSADGQGITLMKLDKVEWWSTQHTDMLHKWDTAYRFASLYSPRSRSPDRLGPCSQSLLSYLHLSCTFPQTPSRSPAWCSTRGPVSSSGKVSPVCREHCRQPVSPSTLPSTLPKHTQTHVSTSPPLTGRCHTGRQLHSLVWQLSSNQRSSSLSTETWPRGYHCHTACTPLGTHSYMHANTQSSEEGGPRQAGRGGNCVGEIVVYGSRVMGK